MTEGSSNAIDEDTQQQLREQVNHCYGPYATAGDARSTSTTNNKENEGTTRQLPRWCPSKYSQSDGLELVGRCIDVILWIDAPDFQQEKAYIHKCKGDSFSDIVAQYDRLKNMTENS